MRARVAVNHRIGNAGCLTGYCPVRLTTEVEGDNMPKLYWQTTGQNLRSAGYLVDGTARADIIDVFPATAGQRFKAHSVIEIDGKVDGWQSSGRLASYGYVAGGKVAAASLQGDVTPPVEEPTQALGGLEVEMQAHAAGVFLVALSATCSAAVEGSGASLDLWFLQDGQPLPNYRGEADLARDQPWGVRRSGALPVHRHDCNWRRIVPAVPGTHTFTVAAVARGDTRVHDPVLKVAYFPGAQHAFAVPRADVSEACSHHAYPLRDMTRTLTLTKKSIVISNAIVTGRYEDDRPAAHGDYCRWIARLPDGEFFGEDVHTWVKTPASYTVGAMHEFGPVNQQVYMALWGSNQRVWCASEPMLEMVVIAQDGACQRCRAAAAAAPPRRPAARGPLMSARRRRHWQTSPAVT